MRPALGLFSDESLGDGHRTVRHHDELAHPVTGIDMLLDWKDVPEGRLDLPAISAVDYANSVGKSKPTTRGKPGAREDKADISIGNSDLYSCAYNSHLSGIDVDILSDPEVKTGIPCVRIGKAISIQLLGIVDVLNLHLASEHF